MKRSTLAGASRLSTAAARSARSRQYMAWASSSVTLSSRPRCSILRTCQSVCAAMSRLVTDQSGARCRTGQRHRDPRRVVQLGHGEPIELRMQGNAKHGRIATLYAEGDIHHTSRPVHRADVPGGALPQDVAQTLVLKIVTVVFQLQKQWRPGCLVLRAAE